MKVTFIKNNGYRRWKLDIRLAGRRIRRFFPTESDARAAGEALEAEAQSARGQFAHCRTIDISKMLLAQQMCQEDGRDLMEIVTKALAESDPDSLPIGTVYRRYLKEKREMGVAKTTLNTIECTLERFCSPQWDTPIGEIGRADILAYLKEGRTPQGEPWHTRTKIGYLKEIQGLFAWAKKIDLLKKDPAATVPRPKYTAAELEERETRKEILTPEEIKALLTHCVTDYPHLLPRLTVQLFAGLRPNREAAGLKDEDILLEEGLVLVRGKHAKDRQRRYIKMVPALQKWLAYCKKHKLTFPCRNWKRDFNALRKAVNLSGPNWPKNATRHSFASYHLALYGEADTKKAMGHGSYDMIFQHYRTLVRESEAAAVLEIAPPNH